jgi:hypothetical protein
MNNLSTTRVVTVVAAQDDSVVEICHLTFLHLWPLTVAYQKRVNALRFVFSAWKSVHRGLMELGE